MKYIFREHFIFTPMENPITTIRRTLIFEPQFELAQLYAKYLTQQNMEVHICQPEDDLQELVVLVRPHLLVYNIDRGYGFLGQLKYIHPALVLITVADEVDEKVLDSLMALGVSGHINRKLSRPRDVAELAAQTLAGLSYS